MLIESLVQMSVVAIFKFIRFLSWNSDKSSESCRRNLKFMLYENVLAEIDNFTAEEKERDGYL